ncbi:MAG: DUF2244 domain-containing protein [Alphaproteobacteria bacterium]|nr:DUF2244 domain-containing protein [Alphaproteobacteria bacterium]
MTSAPTPDDRILFDAVVYPHRSLSKTGFLVVMGLIAGCSFSMGVAFYLVGAWPVVGFLGLDVLIIYAAFRLNYRQARAYETLTLRPDRLDVVQVDLAGRARHATLQPYWLSVVLETMPGRSPCLILRSHGRRVEIAAFLPDEEKAALAESLRRALAEVRTPTPHRRVPG